MAKPREARGWFVYAVAVGVAFLALAFRLYYAGGVTSPFLVLTEINVPLMIAILAGALAALGLHQALWYSLVKPQGRVLYVASLLMFVLGLLLFYALPDHLSLREVFLLQFVAGFGLFLYTPTLSWGLKSFIGVGIAAGAALLVLSLYEPLLQSGPDMQKLQHWLVLATLAAEALLVLTLLRLGQISFPRKAASAASSPD